MRIRSKVALVAAGAVLTMGAVLPAASAGPVDDAVRIVQNLPVDGALRTAGDLIRYATGDRVTKVVLTTVGCVVYDVTQGSCPND